MKRTVLILSIVMLNLFQQLELKAQYVTIPDANFVAYLQAHYPSCMWGNQMDTTCVAITTETALSIINTGIHNLTGVEYFVNLQNLDCSYDTIRYFPPFPNSLTNLWCISDSLVGLPVLPQTLQLLDCKYNLLQSLVSLPPGLVFLDCSNNQLGNLSVLPSGLTELNCSNNQLFSLPALPSTIAYLYCDSNPLPNLPQLPANLVSLFCNYNNLNSLPSNLPLNLQALICSHNNISIMPLLPATLTDFDCSFNQLTSLPALPSGLTYLICYNNNILCIPVLPSSLVDSDFFDLSNNPFSCLPNYVPAMDATYLAYPLCILGDMINNPNNCISEGGITGNLYKDINSNCIDDAGDTGANNIHMKEYDNGGNLIAQSFSFTNGTYYFQNINGTYRVEVDTIGTPYAVQCPISGNDSTVSLSSAIPLIQNVNFDITCPSGFDIGIQSITRWGQVRPGLQHQLRIVAGDMSHWYNLNCAGGISGTVQVTLSNNVTYVSPAPGGLTPIVTGNVLTYAVADFATINNITDFNSILLTDTTAQAGDVICATVVVTPFIDNDTTNNTYSYCYTVQNSFDPNEKETYPVNVSPGYNDYFTYTVHFQNAGTASAINIRVTDTLSQNLDMSTFQMINYSNPNITNIEGNRLTVRFPNINLADSTSNEPASHGYFQYRIKPLANLPAGTQILNTANIYFDFNSPINTNTTVNNFLFPVGINQNILESSVTVYPNPATDKLTITCTKNKIASIKIVDVVGREIRNLESGIRNSNTTIIDMSGFTKGVYFVQVTDEFNNKINRKIIKE